MKITLAIIVSLLLSINVFGQTLIFSDSFAGTFPGTWSAGNDGGITGSKWGDNSYKSTGDGWSAFCADNGSNTARAYPNNLHTYMEQRNVSLVGYSTATLSFKYTGNTQANVDYFTVNIRNQSGSWSEVFRTSGTLSTWIMQTINLNSFCGQSGLYVQFRFDSNNKTTGQGIWLDDIALTAGSGAASSITVTSPNGGESWEIGSSKNITWTSTNLTGSVKIEINRNYASGTWEVLNANTPNDGSEPWLATGPAATGNRIRITSLADPNVSDISNSNFTLMTSSTISQISWSGYTWNVKSGLGNPGPNNWLASSSGVWVDAAGNLHMKISKIGNLWYCSEIFLAQSLGYGEYTFEVSTNVENLDKNIVLGLFTYETDTREIDIEFARWGVSTNPAGQYVLQPSTAASKYNFTPNLTGDYSTHKFSWSASEVLFQSFHGHGTATLMSQWVYKGSYNPPAGNERIHLNLWLYQGAAPSNLQEAEVVIKSFRFSVPVPAITVISPNGSENWTLGTTQSITWASTAITGNVSIELDENYPSGIWRTLFGSIPNDGAENWTVSGTVGNAKRIRISSVTNTAISDFSNNNFSFIASDGVIPLENCVPQPNLSAAKGISTYYRITLPPGSTNLAVTTAGGPGDCDLYVRLGQKPSTTRYDYRSWAAGNAGTVSVANPAPGDYYIMLYAYTAYSGASLSACYTGLDLNPSGGLNQPNSLISGIDVTGLTGVLNIYPNPASDQITVGFNRSVATGQNLEIINSLGQVVYSKSIKDEQPLNKTIDVSSLSKGLYYIRLTSSEGISTSRFIKD